MRIDLLENSVLIGFNGELSKKLLCVEKLFKYYRWVRLKYFQLRNFNLLNASIASKAFRSFKLFYPESFLALTVNGFKFYKIP